MMKKLLFISCLFLLLTSSISYVNAAFFKTSGRNILDRNNHDFLIKGNAISGWQSPETYMLALNKVHKNHIGSFSDIKNQIRNIVATDEDVSKFWEVYNNNFLTEADIAEMAQQGFNTIRIPINYRMLMRYTNGRTNYEFLGDGFQQLDKVIQWCKNQGLYVILDLHSAPGGQGHDGAVDPECTYWYKDWEKGLACLWPHYLDEEGPNVINQLEYDTYNAYKKETGRDYTFNQNRTIEIWQRIAERYRNEEWIIGYELLNEPYLPWAVHVDSAEGLEQLFIRIRNAIRTVDNNHIIFIEGNNYAGSLDKMKLDWDDNLALMFHKYLRPPIKEEVQEHIDKSIEKNLPLVMSESGENSNAWLYEFKKLLEDNNIGWIWWGYKKVDSIATIYSAYISSDYQYVIDNFRNNPSIDNNRAKQGLMDLANSISTDKCWYHPGFTDASFSSSFNVLPTPYIPHYLPGIIHTVNYDIGNQNISYSDTRYMNPDDDGGDPWNSGWKYRNDGVDIEENIDTDSFNNGYNVGYTDSGEWLKYTVNVQTSGNYQFSYRAATKGSEIQLLLNDTDDLTGVIGVPETGGGTNWQTKIHDQDIILPAGTHTLTLKIITGGVNISWLKIGADTDVNIVLSNEVISTDKTYACTGYIQLENTIIKDNASVQFLAETDSLGNDYFSLSNNVSIESGSDVTISVGK